MSGPVSVSFRRLYRMADLIESVPGSDQARSRLLELVNKRLASPGLQIARDPANTPKDTGALIRSIDIRPARAQGVGAIGAIQVGVRYGGFVEFMHRAKPDYLKRAAEAVMQRLADDLGSERALRMLGARVGGHREIT